MKRWKSIPEWGDKYDVSDHGDVRRRVFTNRYGRHLLDPPKPLRPADKDGYKRVTLVHEGRRRTVGVHVLVAALFLPTPIVDRNHVNHIDFDRANNHVSNLEWVTLTENNQHTAAAGRRSGPRRPATWGSRHGQAKLTEAVVSACRERFRTGASVRELADEHGIWWGTMRYALVGRIWAHVPDPVPIEDIPPRVYAKGSDNPTTKLKGRESEVITLRASGTSKAALARMFGVARETITRVLRTAG